MLSSTLGVRTRTNTRPDMELTFQYIQSIGIGSGEGENRNEFILTLLCLYRVFGAVIVTALAIGHSSAYAPDTTKAKASAARVLSLLKRTPAIDASSSDGKKLVCRLTKL